MKNLTRIVLKIKLKELDNNYYIAYIGSIGMKTIIIKGISDKTKKSFQKLCIDNDISLKEGIIRLMEYAIKRNIIPNIEQDEGK